MNKPWWKSSAITGALIAAASAVSPYVIQAIPPKYAVIGAAIGFVVNQVGQRTATAKNGNGQ